jgi:hypothetical protein
MSHEWTLDNDPHELEHKETEPPDEDLFRAEEKYPSTPVPHRRVQKRDPKRTGEESPREEILKYWSTAIRPSITACLALTINTDKALAASAPDVIREAPRPAASLSERDRQHQMVYAQADRDVGIMKSNISRVLLIAEQLDVSVRQPMVDFLDQLRQALTTQPSHMKLPTASENVLEKQRVLARDTCVRFLTDVEYLERDFASYTDFLSDLFSTVILRQQAHGGFGYEGVENPLVTDFAATLASARWDQLTVHKFWTEEVRMYARSRRVLWPWLGISRHTCTDSWLATQVREMSESVKAIRVDVETLRSDLTRDLTAHVAGKVLQQTLALLHAHHWHYMTQLTQRLQSMIKDMEHQHPQPMVIFAPPKDKEAKDEAGREVKDLADDPPNAPLAHPRNPQIRTHSTSGNPPDALSDEFHRVCDEVGDLMHTLMERMCTLEPHETLRDVTKAWFHARPSLSVWTHALQSTLLVHMTARAAEEEDEKERHDPNHESVHEAEPSVSSSSSFANEYGIAPLPSVGSLEDMWRDFEHEERNVHRPSGRARSLDDDDEDSLPSAPPPRRQLRPSSHGNEGDRPPGAPRSQRPPSETRRSHPLPKKGSALSHFASPPSSSFFPSPLSSRSSSSTGESPFPLRPTDFSHAQESFSSRSTPEHPLSSRPVPLTYEETAHVQIEAVAEVEVRKSKARYHATLKQWAKMTLGHSDQLQLELALEELGFMEKSVKILQSKSLHPEQTEWLRSCRMFLLRMQTTLLQQRNEATLTAKETSPLPLATQHREAWASCVAHVLLGGLRSPTQHMDLVHVSSVSRRDVDVWVREMLRQVQVDEIKEQKRHWAPARLVSALQASLSDAQRDLTRRLSTQPKVEVEQQRLNELTSLAAVRTLLQCFELEPEVCQTSFHVTHVFYATHQFLKDFRTYASGVSHDLQQFHWESGVVDMPPPLPPMATLEDGLVWILQCSAYVIWTASML